MWNCIPITEYKADFPLWSRASAVRLILTASAASKMKQETVFLADSKIKWDFSPDWDWEYSFPFQIKRDHSHAIQIRVSKVRWHFFWFVRGSQVSCLCDKLASRQRPPNYIYSSLWKALLLRSLEWFQWNFLKFSKGLISWDSGLVAPSELTSTVKSLKQVQSFVYKIIEVWYRTFGRPFTSFPHT